jgi:hypothetical protein
LAACYTGESNGTADAMDTESAVVRESKEPGQITVSVPRFKLRLTVSTPQEFYNQIIYFELAHSIDSHIFDVQSTTK